ncbi:hypothetical protein V3C99_018002, partial [Haemonchus contortus]
IFFVCTR